MPNNCPGCKNWNKLPDGSNRGVCTALPPQVVIIPNKLDPNATNIASAFPSTTMEQGCGLYEPMMEIKK